MAGVSGERSAGHGWPKKQGSHGWRRPQSENGLHQREIQGPAERVAGEFGGNCQLPFASRTMFPRSKELFFLQLMLPTTVGRDGSGNNSRLPLERRESGCASLLDSCSGAFTNTISAVFGYFPVYSGGCLLALGVFDALRSPAAAAIAVCGVVVIAFFGCCVGVVDIAYSLRCWHGFCICPANKCSSNGWFCRSSILGGLEARRLERVVSS